MDIITKQQQTIKFHVTPTNWRFCSSCAVNNRRIRWWRQNGTKSCSNESSTRSRSRRNKVCFFSYIKFFKLLKIHIYIFWTKKRKENYEINNKTSIFENVFTLIQNSFQMFCKLLYIKRQSNVVSQWSTIKQAINLLDFQWLVMTVLSIFYIICL